jgi:hypothetical protein
MLPLSFGLDVAEFLRSTVLDFVVDMDRIGVQVLPEPPFEDTPALARASSVSRCPKLAAAERHGFVQTNFTDQDLYRFGLAKYAAAMAKFAIKRGVDIMGARQAQDHEQPWESEPEAPIGSVERGITGTVDTLLHVTIDGERIPLPVEIKRTNAKHGLKAYAVWQTIIYMWLLDAPYGYTLTLYDGWKADYKVWTVAPVEGGWRLHDGLMPAKFADDSDIPTDEDGMNYFSRVALLKKLAAYRWWSRKYAKAADGAESVHDKPVKGMSPVASPCGEYKPPRYRQRNDRWGKKGDRMPDTGTLEVHCPLYGYCYRKLLVANNLPVNLKAGQVLEVEGLNGVTESDLATSEATL